MRALITGIIIFVFHSSQVVMAGHSTNFSVKPMINGKARTVANNPSAKMMILSHTNAQELLNSLKDKMNSKSWNFAIGKLKSTKNHSYSAKKIGPNKIKFTTGTRTAHVEIMGGKKNVYKINNHLYTYNPRVSLKKTFQDIKTLLGKKHAGLERLIVPEAEAAFIWWALLAMLVVVMLVVEHSAPHCAKIKALSSKCEESNVKGENVRPLVEEITKF